MKPRLSRKLFIILVLIIQLIGLCLSQIYTQTEDEWGNSAIRAGLSTKEKTDAFFYDDFESGANKWDLANGRNGGWDLGSVDGNSFLLGEGHYFASPLNNYWLKPGLKAKFKLNKGTIHICIRNNHDGAFNRYAISISSNRITCFKQEGNKFTDLKQFSSRNSSQFLKDGKWHAIVVWLHGNVIKCEIDREPPIAFIDNGKIIDKGGIAFETLGDSSAFIDNVVVFPYPEDSFFGFFGEHAVPEHLLSETEGGINIWSKPSGARIWLDGIYQEKKTPYLIHDIVPGKHKIELQKDGYKIFSKSVTVEPRKEINLTAKLEKEK